MTTGLVAVLTWLVTATLGFILFGTWLWRGGVSQQPPDTRLTVSVPPPYFPAPLVFTHFLLALAALLVWVVYLVTDVDPLAWIALAMLLPIALFGYTMFARWLGSRRARVIEPWSGVRGGSPESHLPSAVVFCHGLFGVTTILFVLLTVVGVRIG